MAKEASADSDAYDGSDEHTKAKDREGKELQEIRQRRKGGGKMFLSKIEDFVLLGGIAYGVLFALLLFSMSSRLGAVQPSLRCSGVGRRSMGRQSP